MQSFYPEHFERDMGCTEAQWLAWLPAAVGQWQCKHHHQAASVRIDQGRLELTWQSAAPRTIALLSIPRLTVRFCFTAVGETQRYNFMKRFDLYMQRGGG
jgi:hypothetical protein